jgi:hypothetical protein
LRASEPYAWKVKHPYEEISRGVIKIGEIIEGGNPPGSSYFDNVTFTKK